MPAKFIKLHEWLYDRDPREVRVNPDYIMFYRRINVGQNATATEIGMARYFMSVIETPQQIDGLRKLADAQS